MELEGIFAEKKGAVLGEWFQFLADSYADKTSRFLEKGKDRFANPVGFAYTRGLEGLYDGLLAGSESAEMAPHLDEIVRIRAVQDFTPSAAVAFILGLKGIVRRTAAEANGSAGSGDLALLEERIDTLALQAFDNYMACREKLFEIKVKELRERASIQAGQRPVRAARRGETRDETNQEGTMMKRGEE